MMKFSIKALAAIGILGFAGQVLAHSDIHVGYSGSAITVHGDESLIDALTGYSIFEGDFGDLAGGPYVTDDPGFLADAGSGFTGSPILGYRALGALQYWNGTTWGAVAGQERVHVTDSWGEDSIFALSGTSGKSIGLIDQFGTDGSLHAHIDYSIENSLGIGNPSVGAYMIQLSLLALDEEFNPLATYGESQSFYMVFNRGLSAEAFEAAIDSRVAAVPVPGAAPLLGSALAMGFALARRRKSHNV